MKTPKRAKAVVFYAEHEGYRPNFEGLLDELRQRRGWEMCYVTSDAEDPMLGAPMAGVRPFYLKTLLPFFMALVNCRVFVMTLTDLNRFHLKRSINDVHYVYVFHSLVSTHMMYHDGAFDHYDSILCVGPHHVDEIRAYEHQRGLPPKTLVEAGYYRLERVHAAYETCRAQHPAASGKTTVLVAPSWGKDNVLESCGKPVVSALLRAGHNVHRPASSGNSSPGSATRGRAASGVRRARGIHARDLGGHGRLAVAGGRAGV